MDAPARRRGWLPALAGTILAALAAISLFTLPAPAPAHADPAAFSAERAMTHISTLADEPHSVLDREAHARARDDVINMFTELGHTPEVRSDPIARESALFPELASFSESLPEIPIESIVVRVPGASDRTLMLMAHYDSAADVELSDPAQLPRWSPGESHGAGDDGYGVAAIVETLRAIQADGRQLEHSLLIVITDAEEVGLLGAVGELERHAADYGQVELVFNVEARGMSGPGLMFETSEQNSALMDFFLAHAPNPVTSSLMPSVYRQMPNSTDLDLFLRAGYTALNLAALSDSGHYHHATDTPEHVNLETVQHYGDQLLGITRAWAFSAELPNLEAERDAHFFPLWRGVTVHYPATVGFLLGGLAILLAAAAIGLRARQLRWAKVAGTAWGLSWRALLGAGIAFATRFAAAAAGLAPPLDMPLGPDPLLMWEFLLGVAIAGTLSARFLVRRSRAGLWNEAAAAVLLGLVAGLVLSLWLVPGGSYLFAIAVAGLAGTQLAVGRARLIVAGLTAFGIVLAFAPVGWFIFEMLGLTLIAVPVLFAVVPITPIVLAFLSGHAHSRSGVPLRSGAASSEVSVPAAGGAS